MVSLDKVNSRDLIPKTSCSYYQNGSLLANIVTHFESTGFAGFEGYLYIRMRQRRMQAADTDIPGLEYPVALAILIHLRIILTKFVL